MRNLHSDHGVIYTDEKVQKITQVRFVDNGTLKQVLRGLGWFGKYLHILRTYRRINLFTGFYYSAVGQRTQHLLAELGTHVNLI